MSQSKYKFHKLTERQTKCNSRVSADNGEVAKEESQGSRSCGEIPAMTSEISVNQQLVILWRVDGR